MYMPNPSPHPSSPLVFPHVLVRVRVRDRDITLRHPVSFLGFCLPLTPSHALEYSALSLPRGTRHDTARQPTQPLLVRWTRPPVDMTASPVKRRVLGALNPNASSPRPLQIAGTKAALPQSVAPTPGKRTIDSVQASPTSSGDPVAKRARLTGEEGGGRAVGVPAPTRKPSTDTRQAQPQSMRKPRSPSPADDSIFDHSAADTSQATAITEPDAERHAAQTIPSLPSLAGSVPRRPAPRLTRQQAREVSPPPPLDPVPDPADNPPQKAEILRLRLGLANYKVRTGQTDVPLERLQQRPIPGNSRAPPARPNPTLAPALGVREVAQARADIIGRFREVAQMNAPVAQAKPQPRRLLPRAPVARPVDEEDDYEDDESDALPRLPPLHPQERAGAEGRRPTTPQRVRPPRDEAELSSSALRGGAASGLLCLSRS